MTRNANVRFMNNNLAADAGVLSSSGAASGFPASNIIDPYRFKKWVMTGSFLIVAGSNDKLYVNDGTNKTVTLTAATYTGTTLAAHIQTQLNASSTLWTCTYSTTTYAFTIGRSSGTKTLRLTQTTAAVWDTIGYTGAADQTAAAADEQRNHTYEFLEFDFGVAKRVRAAIVIGTSGEEFPFSSTAVLRVQANSVRDWTSPPLDVTMTFDRRGAVRFLDDLDDSSYRYWRCKFTDRTNPSGPALTLANVYLGDYISLDNHNVEIGFKRKLVDPSSVSYSDAGVPYARRKTKYWTYGGLQMMHLTDDDRDEIETMVEELGTTTPFFIAIDPLAGISASVTELTKYVMFDSDPDLDHIRYNMYSFAFNVREVL